MKNEVNGKGLIAVLTSWAMTTYQGRPADEAFSLRLSEIAEYQLATEERTPDVVTNLTIIAIVTGLLLAFKKSAEEWSPLGR